MMTEDKIMYDAADKNKDGILNFEEFIVFSNPEEHPEMHEILIRQTLKEKDLNNDGKIDFQEFIGERGIFSDLPIYENNIHILHLLKYTKYIYFQSNRY